MKRKGMREKLTTAATMAAYALVGLLSGCAVGVVALWRMDEMLPEDAPMGVRILLGAAMMAAFYLVMTAHTALHEGGHWLFGRLTRWRLVSFRLYRWMWIRRNDGRLHFARYRLAGTEGQCLMAPPPHGNWCFPVMLYNLGGALANLFVAALSLAAALIWRASAVVWTLGCVSALVGAGFALINGIPLRTIMMNNDGMNALELRRSTAARRAFWIQAQINADLARGVRLRDMPETWFTLPTGEDCERSLTASLAVFAANRLMDQHRFDEADALMARLLAHPGGIPPIYRQLMVCDRIYCLLLADGERAGMLLDGGGRKAIRAMRAQLSAARTEYAVVLLLDDDSARARKLRERFDKMARGYPNRAEADGERELVAIIERMAR